MPRDITGKPLADWLRRQHLNVGHWVHPAHNWNTQYYQPMEYGVTSRQDGRRLYVVTMVKTWPAWSMGEYWTVYTASIPSRFHDRTIEAYLTDLQLTAALS